MAKKSTGRVSRFMTDGQKRDLVTKMLEQMGGVRMALETLGEQVGSVVGGSSGNAQSCLYLREIGDPKNPSSISSRADKQVAVIEEKLHAALGALRP